MTRNLYLGADLTPVTTAAPEEIPLRVAQVWQQVQATDFMTRAQAIAAEIAANNVDVVGLQEAALWRIQSPGDFFTGNTPATTVALDFVEILRAALASLGSSYEVAVSSPGFDIELPSIAGDDIRFTDREVVLIRSGLWTTNAQAGCFNASH